jgi:hypothetical protein
MPTPTGGERLSRGVRSRAEVGLGHDFSHVRLHRGPDAERVTSEFHAEGVTTGSHVYLRPGLSTTGGFGQHVLHHELAHVVQQAGPRPLGGRHGDMPSVGSDARHIRLDPARESAADRAASRAASGVPVTAPADVGGRSSGIQPKFAAAFVQDMLKRLTGPGFQKSDKVEKAVEEVAKRDLEGNALVAALQSALPTALLNAKFHAPFEAGRDAIKKYITAETQNIAAFVPELLKRAGAIVSGVKEGDKPAPQFFYLPPKWVGLEIERFLFDQLGLVFKVQIKPNDEKQRVGAKQRLVVDTNAPIKLAELAYVHLPNLAPHKSGNELWEHLLNNTFGKGYPDYVKADSRPLYQAAARLIVGRYGPRPNVFASRGDWRLSRSTAKSIDSLAGRIATVAKGKWPSPRDYANPSAQGGVGAVGLRVGTYGVWGPMTTDERQAHHITQFLLMQFLANAARHTPFYSWAREKGLYPGLEPLSGGKVNKISGLSGTIDVAKWYGSGERGDDMPTIFLSTYTHQSGIHYRSSKSDEPGQKDAQPGQSATLRNEFTKAAADFLAEKGAPGEGQRIFRSERSGIALGELSKLQQNAKGDNDTKGSALTKNKLREAIFVAARAVYKDMHDDMDPKLAIAIRQREVQYYNEIAKQKQMTDELTSADVKKALDAARDANDAFAKKAGLV